MKRIILAGLTMALSIPAHSHSAETPFSLSMSQAISMAAEKNLDVRVERYTPALFEADIRHARSIYDPILNLQTSYGSDATKWNGSVEVDQFDLNSTLSQLFWTGGTASASFSNAYSGSSGSSRWQSKLGGSITQPLLKNSGREATEITINVSRLSKFASLEKVKATLINTISQVKNQYYNLSTARKQLEVKKVSLALAQKILQETKGRVAAGVLPAMEILNAEFGVTTREKEVIEAEKSLKDQIDTLRLLLQIEGSGELITTDTPTKEKISVSEADGIAKAILRPEIREAKRNLEISELQTRLFKNKLRPDLSLTASAGVTGTDSTYKRDIENLTTFDHPVWSVGLNLTYPLGNNAAENDYKKTVIKSEQIKLQIKNLEESASNEVRAAIRNLDSGFKQIEVADRGVAFAEERLRAFMRKNEVGLATTKDVLDVENDLATAKINQLTALVSYNNAITRYWQVTGELLDREGIVVLEGDSDKLYSSVR